MEQNNIDVTGLSKEELESTINESKQSLLTHQNNLVKEKKAKEEIARRIGQKLNQKGGKLIAMSDNANSIFNQFKSQDSVHSDYEIIITTTVINKTKKQDADDFEREKFIEHIDNFSKDNRLLTIHTSLSDLCENSNSGRGESERSFSKLLGDIFKYIKKTNLRQVAKIRNQYDATFGFVPKVFAKNYE